MHLRAAQFLGGSLLPNGGLHQRRPRQKQPAAIGHQDVIAHHRQVRAAGHAHSHDRGDLRNAHGAHHRVVAEDAAEIVGVGEDIFLQRQKNARRVDQIDRRDAVLDGDILRADHFLRRHREKRPGLHRGVVGDDHHPASGHMAEAGDHARRGRAAPLLVHLVGGVEAQLEKLRVRVDQPGDALAGGEASLLVLRLDGLRAAALADALFFILDLRQAIDHLAAVFLERRGIGIDGVPIALPSVCLACLVLSRQSEFREG